MRKWWRLLSGEMPPYMEEPTMKIWFVPCDNITAYELAQILKKTSGLSGLTGAIYINQDNWYALSTMIKRHFTDQEP